MESQTFEKSKGVVVADYTIIGDITREFPAPEAPEIVLMPSTGFNRIGGFTKLAIDVFVGYSALADFRLLAKVHKNSDAIVLLSGSEWGTATGILRHKVGAINTLAANGHGVAYIDIGPLYAIAFDAKGAGANIAVNGTFTGDETGWTLTGSGLAYDTNNVTWAASSGVMKQLVASMSSPWVAGQPYEVVFTISDYGGGTLYVGTNTNPMMESVDADGSFLFGIQADAHADGLVFTGDDFTGTIDAVTLKPMSFVTVRGGLYR